MALAAALPKLVDELANEDVRFAVVSTSFRDDAPAPTFYTPEDVDALVAAALQGTSGDDMEQGVRSAQAALASGVFRQDAWVSVILITDEEECSHFGVLDGEGAEACYHRLDELPSAAELYNGLQASLGRSDLDVHGIVGVTGGTCEAWASVRLAALITIAGGTQHDICAPSFDQAVSGIVADLSEHIAR